MRTWKLVFVGLSVSTVLLACGTAAIDAGDPAPTQTASVNSTTDASAKPSTSTATATVTPTPAVKTDGGAPDAATMTATFPVGLDACNGGACNGGYDGDLQPEHISSATKLCTDLGFTSATTFTFDADDQPGGRFCDFSKNAWGCDDSCDGCNPMTSVTCTK